MKPVSSSDAEIEWVIPAHVYSRSNFNHNVYPSKLVIGLINQIERGSFPVIELVNTIDGPCVAQKSNRVYEAYMRCHFSRLPVIYVEKEKNDRDSV